jgi:cell division inhibitor SulA
MNTPLDDILQQPGVWRGREIVRNTGLEHTTTGFAELDRLLPGGGWPLGALTELYHGQPGIGELRLLMPALARLSRQGRWVALIAPPYIPYAPALAAFGLDLKHVLLVHPKTATDGLWALEQGLRSGTCGAVLAWPRQLDQQALRRLQLAAETGKSWGILFRDPAEQTQSSPAALRLRLEAREGNALVHLLKCRGGVAGAELTLDLSRHTSLEPTPAAAPAAPEAAPAATPRPAPRPVMRPRRLQPLRRPEPPPQLDLPLPVAPGERRPPLRQDKPGILTWRWRK